MKSDLIYDLCICDNNNLSDHLKRIFASRGFYQQNHSPSARVHASIDEAQFGEETLWKLAGGRKRACFSRNAIPNAQILA